MNLKLIVIAIFMMPGLALACAGKEQLVVACNTENGKRIEICQTPTGAVYSFGRPGQKPELLISDNGKNFRWARSYGTSGGGELFQFTNGAYAYIFDRYEYRNMDDEGKLTVKRGDRQIAQLRCVDTRIDVNTDLLTREKDEHFEY